MQPPGDGFLGDRTRRWLTYSAAAVVLVYLGFMLSATEGHFVPQVVDLYLVCQYARAFAEGHPFQYNVGEPPSTGATSVLFTAVLGAAHAAGIRGEGLIAFAILVGATLYGVAVRLAASLASRVSGSRESLLAAALVVLGGPLVWAFLYGSDTGVFMVLFLWLTERLFADSPRGAAAAATLLALARPEGLPIALVLLAAGRFLWPRDRRARLLVLPVLAGISVLLLNRMLTGYWVSTSVADKSLLANYGPMETMALVAEYAMDVLKGLLLGLYPAEASIGFAKGWAPYYFPPLALLIVAYACATIDAARKRAVITWATMVAAVFVLISPSLFMGVHFNRHLMWAFPTIHVFVAIGLSRLTQRMAPGDPALERRLFASGAGLLLVFGALSTARFAAVYGESAGIVYRRDVAAATWISQNLPRGVSMANLATSVEYLTGHRNLNLHGVTSPAFFGNRTGEREMGVFESLGRLGAADRPAYLITSVATHESQRSMQELVALPPVYRTTSFGDDILIFRMKYDLVGKNRRMLSPAAIEAVRGLTLVDELNVGDNRAEREHDYAYRSAAGNLRLGGSVRPSTYPGNPGERLLDGGRAIIGWEAFHVAARRGKDLTVVMRTAPDVEAVLMRSGRSETFAIELPEATIAVTVEDKAYQRLGFKPRAGWDEQVFKISGGALGPTTTHLELRGAYASFYYWFYQ